MQDFNNIFNNGFSIGRFWISFIIHEAFFGLDFGIGKQIDEDEGVSYLTLSIQIGYGLFVIGFDLEEK